MAGCHCVGPKDEGRKRREEREMRGAKAQHGHVDVETGSHRTRACNSSDVETGGHGSGAIGHGSDSTMHDGVLVMSRMIYLTGAHSTDSMALVDTLHTKLTMHATVFLDSCFAGINGIAEMFSQKMPEHWVMGGVVSLESYIKVHPTPFDGSAESGPTQVTSEIAEDKVIDPNVPHGCQLWISNP